MTTTNSVQFPGESGPSVPQQKAPSSTSTAPLRRQSTVRKIKEAAKSLLPAPLFLSLLHHKEIGRYPSLLRPTTFNEKILRKSLRPDPWFAELTDKLTVRKYVARVLGEEHVIPLLAAPDTFSKEVFDALPNSFVMKANHGSSYVEVVRDKSTRSFEELRELADHWLTLDFYKIAREKHYRQIEPRVFFEHLLLDKSGQIPADYKLHCFGGRSGRPTIYILVISDRFGSTRVATYTTPTGTIWTWRLAPTNPVQSRRPARRTWKPFWTPPPGYAAISIMFAWTCMRRITRFTSAN